MEGATLMGQFTSQGLSSRVGAFEIHVHHLPSYFHSLIQQTSWPVMGQVLCQVKETQG